MTHTPTVLALFALALAGCGKGPCCETGDCLDRSGTSGTEVLRFKGSVPSNILFLSIDTLRKDHLGAYGSTDGLTPFLDRVASEGVVLDDHLQCSNWTWASTTCTLAGRTNIERGHMPRLSGPDETKPKVPNGTPFLATWLTEAGFQTTLVTSNSFLSDKYGNTQGYQRELFPSGNAEDRILEGSRQLKRGSARDPWFLHVHMMEPHAPYKPLDRFLDTSDLEPWPEDLTKRPIHYDYRDSYGSLEDDERDLLEAHLRRLYAAQVRTLDHRIERAWKALDEDCWLDDTLVVIWSDHGEAFWEHGFNTHAFHLTAEENDGVAIFWAKNLEPGRWTGTTSTTDVVPTLLDLYDIPMPGEVTGYPLGTAPPDRPIFTSSLARLGGVQAVVRDGMKLHYNWTGTLRMWDREADPAETEMIYEPGDPVAAELWELLEPQVDAMAPLVVGGEPAPIKPAEF